MASWKNRVRIGLLGSATLTFALGAAPALAQEASTQPQPEQEQGAATPTPGDEIIVTAQRREERLQDVPIAITALGSEELQATGVATTETLRAAVPSLNVTTAAGGFGLPRIRGIGATGAQPGIENPVAIYVDGVYYGASFGALQSLYDVDQVTVLKGPQGTLFGRNATGGLIQIQTRNPSLTETTASAQFGYGNYDTATAAGFISIPLANNLAFSISGQYEDRGEGFGRNLLTGNDVQAGRTYVGRAKLLWEPGPDTRILLSLDGNGRDASDPAFRTFSLNTLGENVTQQILNLGGDPEFDIYADVDPRLEARQWGTSLTIDQGIGEYQLKSITAYRHSSLFTFFDPDGTTLPTLIISNDQFDNQFSQELSLLSPSTGPFRFVAGLFYLHDEAGIYNRTTGLAIFGNRGYSDLTGDVTLNSYSGFAEGTFTFGTTNITGGIRYTQDERSFVGQTVTFNGNTNTTTTGTPLVRSVSFGSPSWRLSVDHRFSPELLVYASYNRGFRAGAFVPQVAPVTILQPEEVDAFEVGFKSDLFDRRLRINIAGYYFDQSTVQVFQIIAGVQNVYNAQGAEIYGIDGDITWNVTNNLRFFGGFSYNHARYKEFTDAVIAIPFPVASNFSTTNYSYVDSATGNTVANTACLGVFVPPNITTQAARDAFYRTQRGGNCLIRGDASGNRLQNTPDFTFSLGGSWDIPTSIGRFNLSGNLYYNGGFVGDADERIVQDSYVLLDGSVTWNLPGDHVFFRLYARNILNSYYRGQASASNSGDNGYGTGPQTYGVLAGFRF